MIMSHKTLGSLACAAALVAAPAMAQTQGDETWVDIESWDEGAVYQGWSAEQLLDETVYGQYGDDIGELEDIIVGSDGRIERVIVEGSGWLDIGDTHAAVPWSEVQRVGTSSLRISVAEGNLDDYGRFPNMDDMPAAPGNFRVRELIGDFVTANGVGYGTVEDVIFTDDGAIQSVVVYPSYGYGYRENRVALPYNAAAYDPYGAYYAVPYDTATLDALDPFNYGEFE